MIKLSTQHIVLFAVLLQASYWGMIKLALPILPDLDTIFNTPESNVQLMISLSFILSGLSALIWGPLIDQVRVKSFIFVVALLGIVLLSMTMLVTSFWLFSILYIICCVLTNAFSVYSRVFPVVYLSDQIQIKKSLSLRFLGGYSAAFFAPLMAGWISTTFGWRYIFMVIIVWLTIICIMSCFLQNEHAKESPRNFYENIRQTIIHLQNKSFRRNLLAINAGNMISQSYVVSIPFWLEYKYHTPIYDIAFYMLPILLPGMVLPCFSTMLAHWFGERKLIIFYKVIFALSGIIALILPIIDKPYNWVWVIPGVLASIAVVGLSPIFSYDAFKDIKNNYNSAAGLLSISSYFAGGVGVYIALLINLDTFYLEGLFILLMALLMSVNARHVSST